jgi:hypothetical protein
VQKLPPIDPDQLDECGVLGDALQESGDPHGELIALHLVRADPGITPARRLAIDGEIERHLARHHDALYGTLADHAPRPGRTGWLLEPRVWRAGFLDVALLRAGEHLALAEVYRRLRTLAVAQRVRRLNIPGPDAAFHAALRADPPPLLRSLELGNPADGGEPELQALASTLEDLAYAGRAHPALHSQTLRYLELAVARGRFARCELPALEYLRLTGYAIEGDELARLPRLARVEFEAGSMAADALARIVTRLPPALRRLGLRRISLEAGHLEVLRANQHRLVGLEHIQLSEPDSDLVADELRTVLPNVRFVRR